MRWSQLGKLAGLVLLLIIAAAVATGFSVRKLFEDRYAGQPQVVGLPDGYDPMAHTQPYAGPHPSRSTQPADPYRYPIPIGEPGPVTPTYGGELEYPYACRSGPSGLGQPLPDNNDGAGVVVYALDDSSDKTDRIVGYSKDCSLKTRIFYYYLERDSGEFLPYDPGAEKVVQLDIDGAMVPFVVRVETGTINRHIYVIAMLRGPHDTPEKPDLKHWNRKLVYQFRGGVGIGRRQGRIEPSYIPDRRRDQLRQGYAVAYSTANQTANHYDIALAEDTVARVKRQFSARYHEPLYTIGLGGSGGALQQYLIGQNRPGLLDGGIAQYSFPDMVTQTTRVMDCELLEYYFDVVDADNEKWQKWSHRAWIEGYNARDDLPNVFERLQALKSIRLGRWPEWSRGQTECTQSWRNLTPQIANPRYNYFGSLFSAEVSHRVPWTYWDNLKRVYGTDANGYARRTYDNVGVQYGLAALNNGHITAAEFLHLNNHVGGWKPAAEMKPEQYWRFGGEDSALADMSVWSHHNMYSSDSADAPAQRSVGDRDAIAAAYLSGQVFLGEMSMPIIDLRNYLEPELDMHHSLQSFSARLRMQHGQGHADNQLIWFTRQPHSALAEAFVVLDRWLLNMASHPGESAASQKPADATDRCYDSDGALIDAGERVFDGAWNGRSDGPCMKTYPIFSNPRIVAGDDYLGDIFKCHLQTVDEAISSGLYLPVDMSAHRDDLQRVFPEGVCDYSRGDAARPADVDESGNRLRSP